MVPLANNAQKEKVNKEAVEEYIKIGFEGLGDFMRQFTKNDTASWGLLCAGLEILGPRIEVELNRIVMDIPLDFKPHH